MTEEFNNWEFSTHDHKSIEFTKSLMNDWVDGIVKENKKEGSLKIKVHLRYQIFEAPTYNNCESPMIIEYDQDKTERFDGIDQNLFISNEGKIKTFNTDKFELDSNFHQQLSDRGDQSQILDDKLSFLQPLERAGAGFLHQEKDYLRENTRKNEYGESGDLDNIFKLQPKEYSPASRKDLQINLRKPFLIENYDPKEEKDKTLLESKGQSNGKPTNSKIYNGSLPEFIDLSKVDQKNIKDLGGDPKQLIVPLKIEKI